MVRRARRLADGAESSHCRGRRCRGVAFVDYFPTHYRRRLYEELAVGRTADFYFFADQRERWSDPTFRPSGATATTAGSSFRATGWPGEAIMPGSGPAAAAGAMTR